MSKAKIRRTHLIRELELEFTPFFEKLEQLHSTSTSRSDLKSDMRKIYKYIITLHQNHTIDKLEEERDPAFSDWIGKFDACINELYHSLHFEELTPEKIKKTYLQIKELHEHITKVKEEFISRK